ncbi:hypothetical protein A374_15688 [Fictibacillus macauensis ZFHKF-1]|uniref:Knr4/Smi1-like domain-containing protein n=1 Tax=Fictibacillus macauensis ZFHKF-1 TaxID=1196324 RepID=I8AF35_9BACL|nr:SMI1/KNR4 family protein [Fictibacillus macauensis]EIT84242.1 hypothetical protein A374_15688 [Fictibacillus macauensis ZFHKF-1]
MKNMIQDILNGFKQRLDQTNQILVQSTQGYLYTSTITFNQEVVSSEQMDTFTQETGWVLPKDYQAFLAVHNGMKMFGGEWIGDIELFRMEEIVNWHDESVVPRDSFPIGYFPDVGAIMIDADRYKKGDVHYMWLSGIENYDLNCNFVEWLDRIIMAQGNAYWDWTGQRSAATYWEE